MQATRLWFMRHGEVEPPWVGTFLGTKDVGLSELGRHQAEAIAAYLEDAPVDAIVSSPRRRALDTAAPLARKKGMRLDVRKALGEMDFGSWEGLRWQQIVERDAEFSARWQQDPSEIACPEGESCNGFAARIHQALDEMLMEYAGRTVAMFAHAGVNRAVLGKVLDRRYVDCMVFAQDYGCVNAVGWTPSGFGQVAMVNFVPGPRSEEQGD